MGALRNVTMAAALAAGVLGAGSAQAYDGRWGGPRYYAPPPPVYYAPRPVYVPPPPVYFAPRPVYVPPPVYYAPRPYYGRGHGWGHYRRW